MSPRVGQQRRGREAARAPAASATACPRTGARALSLSAARAGSEDCRPAARIGDTVLAARPGGRCQ